MVRTSPPEPLGRQPVTSRSGGAPTGGAWSSGMFPCMNESIPVLVASLGLEKSTFHHILLALQGTIDGMTPTPPHLTHIDEIIIST